MGTVNFSMGNRAQIWQLNFEHLWLVGISVVLAVAIGLPVGILLTRRPLHCLILHAGAC